MHVVRCQLPLVLASLLSFSSLIQALRIPFSTAKPERSFPFRRPSFRLAAQDCSGVNCGEDVDSIQDNIYVTNLTVGGNRFQVMLDTGSADLWVNASKIPIPNAIIFRDIVVSESYADQSNFTGPVAFATVEFEGYRVDNQSFLYAVEAKNDNTGHLGVDGLIGLSFDSLSHIVSKVYSETSTITRTFLSNVFFADPARQNFITFFLPRENDLNATTRGGSFTIGEIESGYDAIKNSPALPVVPPTAKEWTVSLDAVMVGGRSLPIPISGVASAPGGKSVCLLDTGTASIWAPAQVASMLYSGLPGARVGRNALGLDTWFIPCGVEPPSLSLVLGGVDYPVHSLDTSKVYMIVRDPTSGQSLSMCLGMVFGINTPSLRWDFILGGPFLRNTYSLYDFGSGTSTNTTSSDPLNPFVRLLSITDRSSISSGFVATRRAQLTVAPPLTADQILRYTNNPSAWVVTDVFPTLDILGPQRTNNTNSGDIPSVTPDPNSGNLPNGSIKSGSSIYSTLAALCFTLFGLLFTH